MTGERMWLRHPDTGGAFHCPAAAVEAWRDLGWEPGEAPEEFNAAVAEMPKPEAEVEPAPAVKAAPTKTSRKGGTDTVQE